jgi:RNA polymerase sigma factor (TIGR02999 family)
VSEITELLQALHRGDTTAGEALLAQVYAELKRIAAHKMAGEQPGNTLQPTALVHEAWLRLGAGARYENRAHFFGAAAEAMRRILIERARRRAAIKRGGDVERCELDEMEIAAPVSNDDLLLAVHEALDRFAARDPQKAELVKLRFFAGLTIMEAATLLGLSERTAKRHWAFARARLADAIDPKQSSRASPWHLSF